MYKQSQNIKGHVVYSASSSGANVRYLPTTNTLIIRAVAKNALVGTTTGVYTYAEGYWLEVESAQKRGWVRQDVVIVKNNQGRVLNIRFPEVSGNSAQEKEALSNIDSYMAIERNVFASLAKCNAFVAICDTNKIQTSQYLSLKKQSEILSNRYNARQLSINKQKQLKIERAQSLSKLIENVVKDVVSLPPTPTYFSGNLGLTVGVGILIVPVVKFALVGIAAVGLWLLLRQGSQESQGDLKISKILEKSLSTLAPKEREAVEKDLQKQIDKAYRKGSNTTMLGLFYTTIKIVAFGTVGFLLAKKLMQKK